MPVLNVAISCFYAQTAYPFDSLERLGVCPSVYAYESAMKIKWQQLGRLGEFI